MDISINVVKKLVKEQFPQWSELDIRPVASVGIDNRTFHLGDDMTVRLPSEKCYEPQVEKEAKWLPWLASFLSLPITVPLGKGEPTEDYPYAWSINRWIDGETPSMAMSMMCVSGECTTSAFAFPRLDHAISTYLSPHLKDKVGAV